MRALLWLSIIIISAIHCFSSQPESAKLGYARREMGLNSLISEVNVKTAHLLQYTGFRIGPLDFEFRLSDWSVCHPFDRRSSAEISSTSSVIGFPGPNGRKVLHATRV